MASDGRGHHAFYPQHPCSIFKGLGIRWGGHTERTFLQHLPSKDGRFPPHHSLLNILFPSQKCFLFPLVSDHIPRHPPRMSHRLEMTCSSCGLGGPSPSSSVSLLVLSLIVTVKMFAFPSTAYPNIGNSRAWTIHLLPVFAICHSISVSHCSLSVSLSLFTGPSCSISVPLSSMHCSPVRW